MVLDQGWEFLICLWITISWEHKYEIFQDLKKVPACNFYTSLDYSYYSSLEFIWILYALQSQNMKKYYSWQARPLCQLLGQVQTLYEKNYMFMLKNKAAQEIIHQVSMKNNFGEIPTAIKIKLSAYKIFHQIFQDINFCKMSIAIQ